MATDFEFVPPLSVPQYLVQQEKEMEKIDGIIRGLEARICKLRAQKESIKALVAPERRLPPEMLSEVFHQYVDSYASSSSFHKNQLLLMRVCRRWRRIAASTPSLWTNLVLEGSTLNPYEIIRMGLTNSGALPMTARVFSCTWDWDDRSDEAIQLLAENFHRFSHFVQDEVLCHELLFKHNDVVHAPLLESFRILSRNEVLPRPWPSARFIRAPRLKTISLPHTLLMDLIPMSLSDVTLVSYPDSDAIPSSMDFLSSCSNIRSLELTIRDIIQPLEGRSRILLPCLKTLVIVFCNEYDPSTFLRTIEIPALQKFSIRLDRLLGFTRLLLNAAIFDSLFGHNHPLQELEVGKVRLANAPLFASVLGRLQDLRRVTLSTCKIDDCILASLTPDRDERASDWKCPSLSELDVRHSRYSLDLLLRLVRSRARTESDVTISGGPYLRCVNVSGPSCSKPSRIAFLAALDDIRKSCGGHLQVIYDSEITLFRTFLV